MASMKDLARLVRELEDQMVVCMRCGMCQAVCPLYAETGREADVARGKLALLEGLSKEMFRDPRGVSQRLQRCLLCGSCAANCPSGVKVLDIFLKARAILAGYMGLSPVKKLILRGMLANPAFFDKVTEWGVRFQDLFTKPANEVLGTSCARFVSPLLGGRHIKPLAPRPFHAEVASLDTAPGSSGLKAAFFVGCLIDKIFPSVAHATLKVLRAHGVGLYVPDNQACCGIPAASSGDMTTFKKLVRHNLDRFPLDRFDVLITSCATCTATLRKVWPVLFSEDDADLVARVRRLSEKTMDIHEFLIQRLGLNLPAARPDATAIPVTYHDPCHLKKSLGVFREPRQLLQAHSGVRLVEMAQPDWCCGLGGSFSLEHYDLSSKVGRRKRDMVAATGARILVTACPACMLQFHDRLSQAGDAVKVRHAVEIYAESVAS
ncbi:(Fe-S)-binding protein [Desulfosoma caldarium]|uniref:Glycolate oxidase iron-sulfur subunit n=1 Tax=Desulfosoma caldarium TaxID=610254 RepID=A0A3N1UPV3_9BACT|nr:(Fe-S)-binding protein [Desulfosoma caldarium]ROQ93165.1 glycolate oxidase iron-sulfur subunit [Desulfosoma caldarium]